MNRFRRQRRLNQLRITDYKLRFPRRQKELQGIFNFQLSVVILNISEESNNVKTINRCFAVLNMTILEHVNFQLSIFNCQLSIVICHLLVLAMSATQRTKNERMTDITILRIRFRKLKSVNDSTTKSTTQWRSNMLRRNFENIENPRRW